MWDGKLSKKVGTEMATQEAIKLKEMEKRALLFLGDCLTESGTDTLESTGLSEAAEKESVCTAKSFPVILYRLRTYGLFESVREKRVALYALTEKGQALYQELVKQRTQEEPQELTTKTQGEKVEMAKSIEEQFHALGVSHNTYAAPTGVTLPKKGVYTEDAAGIVELYKDRINGRADQNEIERLNEWFVKLTAEGRPAFQWLQEAICRTSTKVKVEQRTIGYLIGILKNWGTYGYGSDYSAEHRKLFNLFEARFNCTLTEPSRQKFMLLLDKHGIVDAMTALFETTPEQIDPSILFLIKMEERLSVAE